MCQIQSATACSRNTASGRGERVPRAHGARPRATHAPRASRGARRAPTSTPAAGDRTSAAARRRASAACAASCAPRRGSPTATRPATPARRPASASRRRTRLPPSPRCRVAGAGAPPEPQQPERVERSSRRRAARSPAASKSQSRPTAASVRRAPCAHQHRARAPEHPAPGTQHGVHGLSTRTGISVARMTSANQAHSARPPIAMKRARLSRSRPDRWTPRARARS